MSNFFTTAPAAAAGVQLARDSELKGLAFEEARDNIYRQRDMRALDQQMPTGGLGLAPLPDYGMDDELFGDYQQPEMYQAEQDATLDPVKMSATQSDVRNRFMSVVSQAVTNPYAKAAIAAYAKHESGFDPKNVTGAWSDPSESGKPGTSGGLMSWRNERLDAMRAAGANTPEKQAQFFLKEDPNLVAKLNNARSLEDANRIMADHIRFAGYNRPGGEYASRLNTSRQFLNEIGVGVSTNSGEAFTPSAMPGVKGQLGTQAWELSKQSILDKFGSTRKRGRVIGGTRAAYSWYKSPVAEEYFTLHPEQINAAATDPVGFYDRVGKNVAPMTERFDGEKTADDIIQQNQKDAAAEQAVAQVGVTPPNQRSAPAAPEYKPQVSKAVEAALSKSEGLMNMELRRAQQARQFARQQVQQQYASLNQEYARQQQIAENARRTGSIQLRRQAMDRMAELRQQSMDLGNTAFAAMREAEKQTYKLAADMAVRDLERNQNPARLAHVWRKIGGLNVQIQPRTDGKFNVFTRGLNGETQSVVIDKRTLVNQFYEDLFESVRASKAASEASRATAEFESYLKRAEENVKQRGQAAIEHMKLVFAGQKELEGYHTFKEYGRDGGLIALAKDGSHSVIVDAPVVDEKTGFNFEKMRVLRNSVGLR